MRSFKAFFILLTMSLPLNFHYRDILKKVVCDISSRNCILHVYENCPGSDGVRNFITNCFIENNNDTDTEITYMQWMSTDRTTMNKLTSSVDEYITLLANKVFAFCGWSITILIFAFIFYVYHLLLFASISKTKNLSGIFFATSHGKSPCDGIGGTVK